MVRTRSAVHAVHDLVRELGSEVLHEPQPWPQYGDHYYATFWLDPHGFMLETRVPPRPGLSAGGYT